MAYNSYTCKLLFFFIVLVWWKTTETEYFPSWQCPLCSSERPKNRGSFGWESFLLHLACGAVPLLGLGLMSWINACHASTVQDTPLSHPAWTISTPILPPSVPLPTVFTPLVEELGMASLQSSNQSTTPPPPNPPSLSSGENWLVQCVQDLVQWSESPEMSHLAVTCKRQSPCKRQGNVQLHKELCYLKAHPISWPQRCCESEVLPYLTHSPVNLRLLSFSLNS